MVVCCLLVVRDALRARRAVEAGAMPKVLPFDLFSGQTIASAEHEPMCATAATDNLFLIGTVQGTHVSASVPMR